MVTCSGTVASVVSLLVNETVSGCDRSVVLRVMVAVAIPPTLVALTTFQMTEIHLGGRPQVVLVELYQEHQLLMSMLQERSLYP